jgi:hypothetical protein
LIGAAIDGIARVEVDDRRARFGGAIRPVHYRLRAYRILGADQEYWLILADQSGGVLDAVVNGTGLFQGASMVPGAAGTGGRLGVDGCALMNLKLPCGKFMCQGKYCGTVTFFQKKSRAEAEMKFGNEISFKLINALFC